MTVLINKKLYEMLRGWAKTAKLNKNEEIEFSYDSFFGDEEKRLRYYQTERLSRCTKPKRKYQN
ncbi:MAG: hypothetical protein BWY02_02910 [bacterium ADurb.Bin157]|nr:MAG: hypothetical protein BWY02_02910 [bacterium ADurb.Bin157]